MVETLCKICKRDCCHKIDQIALYHQEAELLRSVGTVLEDVTNMYSIADLEIIAEAHQRIFKIINDCGFLLPPDETGWRKCALVNEDGSPKEGRPEVCTKFRVGGVACLRIRNAD